MKEETSTTCISTHNLTVMQELQIKYRISLFFQVLQNLKNV